MRSERIEAGGQDAHLGPLGVEAACTAYAAVRPGGEILGTEGTEDGAEEEGGGVGTVEGRGEGRMQVYQSINKSLFYTSRCLAIMRSNGSRGFSTE